MRMSCNGCRVLRKGCSDDCTIRPCLHWIASPDSQANATLFLAKFYGRAGLLNLINAGPAHLRPAIFRSLLYEACGRIINPVEGSVGLLCSGNWARCEAAVDGVLRGTTTLPDGPCSDSPATPVAAALSNPAIKAFDIRHVARESTSDPVRLVGSTTRPRSKLRKPRSADHHSGNASLPQGWNNHEVSPEVSPPVLNYPGGDRQDDHDGVGLDLCLGLGLHQ